MELFQLVGKIILDGVEDAKSKLEGVAKTAQSVGGAMEKGGKSISAVGGALAPVSLAVGGVLTASTKMAIGFEDAMAKVSTIADETQVPIGDMQSAILELSNKTGIASSDIAENVYNAISAGQETADAVGFVENATKLATAGFTDSASALDVLTTTLNAYGMASSDVTKVSDMLIQTQNMGKTTVGELASYMGKVIPTAKSANVGLEQVTTAYAKLTANGIQTADSTTYLNSMLNELNKSGTKVSGILQEQTGKSFSELMAEGKSLADVLKIVDEGAKASGTTFSNVWSSAEAGKAGAVINDTSNKLGDFNKAVDQMNQASQNNATDVAFEKMQTSSFNLQKTLNQLKNTAIELGTTVMEMLTPIITQVSEKVHQFTQWFSALDESQKKNIVTIGAVVVALSPALIALGKVVSVVGGIISHGGQLVTFIQGTLLPAIGGISAPVLAVVAVIGVLVGAFVTLWNTNEEFRNKVIGIWEGVKAKFDEFTQGIVDRVNALGFDFENISQVIQAVWKGLCDFLAPVITGALELISNTVGLYLNLILDAWDFFSALFQGDWDGMWEAVKNTFSDVWDAIVTLITTVWNTLDEIFGGALTKIKNAIINTLVNVRDKIVEVWNGIKNFITNVLNAIKTTFTNIWNAVKTTITNVLNSIKTTFTNVWNSIKSFVTSTLNSVKSAIETPMNNALNTVSGILDRIKSAFTDKLNQAKNAVKTAIDTIKGYFNFSWSLPKLKMPHISISGKFSINPPSAPSFGIEWYKKAMDNPMIMDSPTAFGINANGQIMAGGEAGSEVVSGTNTLMTMISEAVAGQNARTEEVLSNILKMMSEYMPQMANMQMVVDSGALVGQIAPRMDMALGRLAVRNGRGV